MPKLNHTPDNAGPSDRLAEHAVGALARAMRNISFYDLTHPVVTSGLEELASVTEVLLSGRPQLVVRFRQGYVIIGEAPMLSDNAAIGNLIGACHRRRVDTINLRRGVSVNDLSRLVEVLTDDPVELDQAGGAGQALAARGVRRITLEWIDPQAVPVAGKSSDWAWIYTTALDVVRGVAAEVRTGQPIDIGSVRASVRDIVYDITTAHAVVHNLNWMKGIDEYTFVHALHICMLAIELGYELGLTVPQLEELGTATLLHDVGKIFVPLEILRKPGKLVPEEFAVISRHPVDGALVLARDEEVPPVASVVAYEHHIHNDYSGYPALQQRRPLHMYSLMTSVVDIYDALTTSRPYRPPLSPRTALAVMQEQLSSRLEPRLFSCFVQMQGSYPCGTLLKIAGDRLAVVTRARVEGREEPLVRVLDLNAGESVMGEETPLREVNQHSSQLLEVDPVSLGLDLASIMRRTVALTADQSLC